MKKVVFIKSEQAREMLGRWVVDTLANDKQATFEALMGGDLYSFAMPVHKFTPEQVAEQIGELNLGEKIGLDAHADMVMVNIMTDKYITVWDIENVEPERRKTMKPKREMYLDYVNEGRIENEKA